MRRRGGGAGTLNPWPGYVDALSTLLMVLVFVLLVFVLAQAFLSVALNGRDQALDRLGRQVAELADMLSLERSKSADLSASVSQLTHDLQAARDARASAAAQASGLQDALSKATAVATANTAENTDLRQRLSDSAAELAGAGRRIAGLQSQLSEATTRADAQNAENLARLADQVRALMALRDQLTAQAAKAADANKTLTEQLTASTQLADTEKARIDLLTKQIDALRAQLTQLSASLDVSQKAGNAKDLRIADLGTKLNAALVSKVAELQRYRSEFFGRLRQVLAGRAGIAVVGDRFVFQSEVLFPAGSADLTPAGREQIGALATTLKSIAHDIPADLPWVLRVDGHADRQAVHGKFASNWELSAERAINVVRLLAADGVPSNRLAAAGFGEFQPVDSGTTPTAYARNRRIELRLTDR
jgi:chemotaxis protein MotB